MARKSSTAVADEVVDPLTPANLAGKAAALNADASRSMEIAERFGDGIPYERERVVGEAKFYMATSGHAMLEAGKRLILLKENEPHGEFTEIVTERLGLGIRTAQNMMAAAAKYLSPRLQSKAQALALLGPTKLFDLMAESDEALDALAEGGTLAGKELDDIQAMTSRELKAALVEARKTLAAKDAVIAKKDDKINRLAEAAELKRQGTVDEREAHAMETLRSSYLAAEGAVLMLLADVDRGLAEGPTETAKIAARQTIDLLVQRIVDACLERGIAVDLAERVSPIYMQEVQQMAAAGSGKRAGKKR